MAEHLYRPQSVATYKMALILLFNCLVPDIGSLLPLRLF